MPKFPDDFLPHNPEDGPPVPRFLPKWPATRDDIEMAVERLELLYIRETARGSKVRVYKKNHKQAIIEVFDVDDMNSLVSLLWATNTRYKLTQYPGVGYRLEFDLDVLETIMSTWKGPPIPSFLLRKEEYIAPPLELEADLSRGVIYLHDTTTGTTILRICRVPSEVMDRIPSYGAELNLETAIPYLGRRRERVFKKSPVFLEVSKILEEMTVVGEGGEIILEVYNIPRVHWKTLQTTLSSNREKVEFTDITVG